MFPIGHYYFILIGRNQDFAKAIFNRTLEEIGTWVRDNNTVALDVIKKTLDKTTLAVNIYYDDLSYTLIEEVPKQDMIDVIFKNLYIKFYLKFNFFCKSSSFPILVEHLVKNYFWLS